MIKKLMSNDILRAIENIMKRSNLTNLIICGKQGEFGTVVLILIQHMYNHAILLNR